MNTSLNIFFILLTYLLGSIPFGYLLTKFTTGKNILEAGSGNIGSTNVGRIAGKKMAIITQLLDMLKGLLPVAIFIGLTDDINFNNEYGVYILALASIIGHDFSIFLKFRGGKGVNTTLGASVLIAPVPVIISVVIYFIAKWQFKFVSLGSIILGISLPLIELFINGTGSTFYYLIICTSLIVVRHHSNIKRLWLHKELLS